MGVLMIQFLFHAPSSAGLDWISLSGAAASLIGSLIVAIVAIKTSKMTLSAAQAAIKEGSIADRMRTRRAEIENIIDAIVNLSASVLKSENNMSSTAGNEINRYLAELRLRLSPDDPTSKSILDHLDKIYISSEISRWSRDLLSIGAISVSEMRNKLDRGDV